jgi:ATP-dependent DNA helicase RecQ
MATTTPLFDSATSHLERMLGAGTTFRPGQLEAIEAVAGERRRVLLVQRTGWGKSAVYFIATRLLRDQGAGPTLLVSPLLALMRDQIRMAERLGVRAVTINSTNPEDFEPIAEDLAADGIDLLLVSPERLANERFQGEMLPLIARRVGLLVVDEAHCISDWGHDFRPDYRRIVRVLELLPAGVPVVCTTATANDRVVADVEEQLGDVTTLRGPLDRESLALAVVDMPSQADRMAWLAATLPRLPGSGIVYTLTVADAERVASFLRSSGIDAEAYSGETDPDERLRLEDALLANDVKALVATSALGMGFDKPDLGFVIHYQSPGSPIAYYQQVGRAGRALEGASGARAPAILLRGHEDREIQDYFIETAFPAQHRADEVVGLLSSVGAPMTRNEIMREVNIRAGRLEAMLKVLEVEGVVTRTRGSYSRSAEPWEYPTERVERITALRRAEQQAMRDYASSSGCLMEFLRRELDDPEAEPCGRCMNCTGDRPSAEVDPALRAAALDVLRSWELTIEPRRQWPSGLGDGLPKGRLPDEERLQPGRALATLGDGGWGELVRRGREEGGAFGDELVSAAADLIRERWAPPRVTWVTCVPSMTRPALVQDFARRLAHALGLPFVEAVRKVRENQPQSTQQNSAQQVRNVWGAFTVDDVLDDPVLLVDDLCDSRWTLTVVGRELLLAGSGPVHPLALATAFG